MKSKWQHEKLSMIQVSNHIPTFASFQRTKNNRRFKKGVSETLLGVKLMKMKFQLKCKNENGKFFNTIVSLNYHYLKYPNFKSKDKVNFSLLL